MHSPESPLVGETRIEDMTSSNILVTVHPLLSKQERSCSLVPVPMFSPAIAKYVVRIWIICNERTKCSLILAYVYEKELQSAG